NALVQALPLASTTAVRIYGAAGTLLVIDNSFGGLIAVPQGIAFDGGAGGGNTLFLTGTAAADTLQLTPSIFALDNAETVSFLNPQTARAFGGAGDSAYLYDSPGDDFFLGTPTYSYLQTGTALAIAAGFTTVQATASTGQDAARLYDSAGA